MKNINKYMGKKSQNMYINKYLGKIHKICIKKTREQYTNSSVKDIFIKNEFKINIKI